MPAYFSFSFELADSTSAIFFDTRAVPTGNAKVRAGLEYKWLGRHGCVPVRAALAQSQSVIFAARKGDSKENLVWLCAS